MNGVGVEVGETREPKLGLVVPNKIDPGELFTFVVTARGDDEPLNGMGAKLLPLSKAAGSQFMLGVPDIDILSSIESISDEGKSAPSSSWYMFLLRNALIASSKSPFISSAALLLFVVAVKLDKLQGKEFGLNDAESGEVCDVFCWFKVKLLSALLTSKSDNRLPENDCCCEGVFVAVEP